MKKIFNILTLVVMLCIYTLCNCACDPYIIFNKLENCLFDSVSLQNFDWNESYEVNVDSKRITDEQLQKKILDMYKRYYRDINEAQSKINTAKVKHYYSSIIYFEYTCGYIKFYLDINKFIWVFNLDNIDSLVSDLQNHVNIPLLRDYKFDCIIKTERNEKQCEEYLNSSSVASTTGTELGLVIEFNAIGCNGYPVLCPNKDRQFVYVSYKDMPQAYLTRDKDYIRNNFALPSQCKYELVV